VNLTSRRIPSTKGALSFTLALLSYAGPTAALADAAHVVQTGDNLYVLARRYLDDPRQWPQLQSINQIKDPLRLMPGRTLVIPAALLRLPTAAAEVLHVAGQPRIQVGPGLDPTPLAVGGRVAEGARIEVGDGGFVTLRLADGSVVRLTTGSTIRWRELRRAPDGSRAQSSIELERGRVDATVKPLPASGNRFEIRTPLAVGGVRGTSFGVALADNGDFVGDVREGAIQVQPLTMAHGQVPLLLRMGNGARVGSASTGLTMSRLLAAPDLSAVPQVVEDIAMFELPLPDGPLTTAWQVHSASDDAGDNVLRNATFTQPRARFVGLEDGRYRLAVRAINVQGIPGEEATRDLIVNARPPSPLLLEPRPGSRLPTSDIEMLCTEGAGVEGYRFQLARDTGFTDLIDIASDAVRCHHTAQALPPGRYQWRVAAVSRDVGGLRDQGPFSQAVAFTVVALPPVPQGLLLDTGMPDTLAIQWGAGLGGPWRFRIQMARDAGFTELLEDRELAEPSYARALPAPGVYHVRVQQIDADGLTGAWTGHQRLEVPSRVTTTDRRALTSSDGRPVSSGLR
jgi:hypothetical protein